MGRILVADDNALSLEFFAESISQCGHIVDTAKDGIEACICASEHLYDLMIIDARMPFRNGPDALRVIRAGNGPSRETRAIATTAGADADPEVLAKAGFSTIAFKPITLDALRALLESQLPATAPRPEVFDDDQGLTGVGGDKGIMVALRRLLAGELDALPGEIATHAANKDSEALRERLHRLDASAGFCGATRLAKAARELRRDLDNKAGWPEGAISALLDASAETRAWIG